MSDIVENIEQHESFLSYGWLNSKTGGLVGSDLMVIPNEDTLVFSMESVAPSLWKRIVNVFIPNEYREVEVSLSKYHISEMTDYFIQWLHPEDDIDGTGE